MQEARGPPQRALVTAAAATTALACLLAVGRGLGGGGGGAHGKVAPYGDRWGGSGGSGDTTTLPKINQPTPPPPHKQQPQPSSRDRPSLAPAPGLGKAGPADDDSNCNAGPTLNGGEAAAAVDEGAGLSFFAAVGRRLARFLGLALSLLGASMW